MMNNALNITEHKFLGHGIWHSKLSALSERFYTFVGKQESNLKVFSSATAQKQWTSYKPKYQMMECPVSLPPTLDAETSIGIWLLQVSLLVF